MIDITIIHPSRGRARKALATQQHWTHNASGILSIEYILVIDQDDPHAMEYLNTFPSYVRPYVVRDEPRNVVRAVNWGWAHSRGKIIVVVSDDFKCFENWDLAIAKALGDEHAVLKTHDGIQDWIVTLPIMHSEYARARGCVYHPSYEHMFCDTDQTHMADILGKLIIRNDIKFIHEHYTTGATVKDEVNKKADATWDRGQATYLQRVRDNFGLPDTVDVWNFRGEQHKRWLKKRINHVVQ